MSLDIINLICPSQMSLYEFFFAFTRDLNSLTHPLIYVISQLNNSKRPLSKFAPGKVQENWSLPFYGIDHIHQCNFFYFN